MSGKKIFHCIALKEDSSCYVDGQLCCGNSCRKDKKKFAKSIQGQILRVRLGNAEIELHEDIETIMKRYQLTSWEMLNVLLKVFYDFSVEGLVH